jgi:nucleoside-diphosphate-sugar epimerase
MKSAVVTGITSSIGISLAALLSEDGVEVTGIVRPGSSRTGIVSSLPGVTVVEMDLSEMGRAMKGRMPDAECFFHLGWDSSFPDSRHNAKQCVNVGNTMRAVDLAHGIGCGTFIGVGSQAECGRVSCKIDENTPNGPENEYGAAKVRAAEESTAACESYGMRCIWPRLLSAYGPFDRPHTLVMSCIDAGLDGRSMELTPCGQIWDYIYVDDAANALRHIAERGRHGVRYPIGSGDGKELKEYVRIMADRLDRDMGSFGIGRRPYPEGQPMYLCADISALTKDTGFRPKVPFGTGFEKTVGWVKGERQSRS